MTQEGHMRGEVNRARILGCTWVIAVVAAGCAAAGEDQSATGEAAYPAMSDVTGWVILAGGQVEEEDMEFDIMSVEAIFATLGVDIPEGPAFDSCVADSGAENWGAGTILYPTLEPDL